MIAQKKIIKEFEDMKDLSELKALSNVSLIRPLTDKEYNKMMELKRVLLNP